jgi:Domain of unknown function (DUF4397)
MKRRTALLGAGSALATPWLAGCGGGPGPDDAGRRLRVLHASVGLDAVDVYLDNDRTSRGLAFGSVSGYKGVSSGVRVELNPADSASVLATVSPAVSGDKDYTLVAYGWAGGVKTLLLADDAEDPDSGRFKLRVLHAAPDAGAVDVYLTGDTEDDLGAATPVAAALAGNALGSFVQRAAGSWRIRVTGAGQAGDLRLDLSGQVLARGQVYTLVLVSGRGGVLVSAVLVAQGGGAQSLPNPSARLRLVASVADLATVDVELGGTPLSAGLVSPTLGAYRLVPAGSPELIVQVNGASVSAPALALASGSDTTLLVTGTAAAPQVSVIADDNRLPSNPTNVMMRLVHAAASLAGANLVLNVNLSDVANAGFSAGSGYGKLSAGTGFDIEITSPLQPAPVFRDTDRTLVAGAVYTVFLLSSGTTAVGRINRDA